jgi:transposase
MKDSTFWAGMDVHADSVQVSVFSSKGKDPVERFGFLPDDRGWARAVRRLKAHGSKVRCVYEAGPCGYEPQRVLASRGVSCEVAAPSLIPRRPGDRVKTDRRDADKLARLYRAGELTLVTVPDAGQESLRDLLRAREDAYADLLRRRHRLSKFLLRHGQRYRLGSTWTQRHWSWIRAIRIENPHARAVLGEYLIAVEEALEQIHRFDRFVEEASRRPEYVGHVDRLKALRGVGTTTALTIVSEGGDLRRYPKAPQFMSATGLVPSEHSSGQRRRQGAITRAGNAHLRRVFVEAAWHYRHRPSLRSSIQKRRVGQPAPVVAIARAADLRLHQKFQRLIARGKRSTEAAVAVARELAGFVWAVGQVS